MASAPSTQQQQQQPAVKHRGIVKSVLSGDTIFIQDADKPSSSGPPPEKQITLSSLSAPRLGRPKIEEKEGTPDEPFAWDSREFLRKKAVGKKVLYTIEYTNPTTGREYGNVYLVEANDYLSNILVAEGWASVRQSAGKETKRPELLALAQLEEAAQQAGKGIYSKQTENAVRPTPKVDSFQLYNQLKGKPLTAIVEQVRTGSTVRVTLLPTFHSLVVLLSGVQAPGFKRNKDDVQEPEPFAREAKFFVETHVLQRDATLTLEGVDKQGNFFGSIEVQGRDVGEELLKGGLASFVSWSATARGPAWVAKLKAAEKGAKETKKRLWANYVEKGDQGISGAREFVGRVTGILNAGAITVLPEGGQVEQTISFSSIRVPRSSYPGDEADDAKLPAKEREEVRAEKAWATEAKEFLRKRLIGAKVKVVLDYVRKPQRKEGERERDLSEKSYYSVYQNDVNVAVALAEAGLVKAMEYKAGDDRTADYELLVLADNKAKKNGKGWHGTPDKAPARRVNDLLPDSSDPKHRANQIGKAKAFLPFLQRNGPHKGVIDYVFSGSRFKITVPGQSCSISFSLSGVKVPKRGESPENDVLSNEALLWVRSKLNQREVTLDVETVDKGGNFVGEILVQNNQSFGVQLVAEGYAAVHLPTVERMKHGKLYLDAEAKAKRAHKNIWKNYDAEEERRKQQAAAAAAEENSNLVPGGGGQEYMDVVVTEALRGDRFYIQVVNAESASLDDLVGGLTELSIEEGPIPEIDPKVGDVVRAQFTDDDNWYRAKIVQALPDRKFRVVYFDYGNGEIIGANRIRVLPPAFHALPVQAHEAALAYIKAPGLDSEWGRESQQALRELSGSKRLLASVEYRDGTCMYLSLADPETNVLVNSALVRSGLARVSRRQRRFASNPVYLKLKEEEERAKSTRVGIWQYGDAPDSDDDEDEPRGAWASGAPKKK